MPAKKAAAAKAVEPDKATDWKCPDCDLEIPAYQIATQPKICTSCGKGKLVPIAR